MFSCKDFAKKLADKFPASSSDSPAHNWLTKLIKGKVPDDSYLLRYNLLNLAWNPQKIFQPGCCGMFVMGVLRNKIYI
jgi:hypothetical protein